MIKVIDGGVTAPKGFQAAGLRAGIKPGKTNKDMAMIYSEVPATVAGTFTKNRVYAAPVKWDRKVVMEQETAQAVVVNTGIANAVILHSLPEGLAAVKFYDFIRTCLLCKQLRIFKFRTAADYMKCNMLFIFKFSYCLYHTAHILSHTNISYIQEVKVSVRLFGKVHTEHIL